MLIGYARVSTEEQTLDLQHDALIRAGVMLDDIYTDKVSGASTKRPGLALAIKRLREGDTLVVWKLDRLGRDLEHLLKMAREIHEEVGAALKSLTEQIEFNTGPMGKMMFQLLGMFAEFERNMTRARTRAGMDAAAARGRKGGRKHYLNADQVEDLKRDLAFGDDALEIVATRYRIKKRTISNYVPGSRNGIRQRIADGVETLSRSKAS